MTESVPCLTLSGVRNKPFSRARMRGLKLILDSGDAADVESRRIILQVPALMRAKREDGVRPSRRPAAVFGDERCKMPLSVLLVQMGRRSQ